MLTSSQLEKLQKLHVEFSGDISRARISLSDLGITNDDLTPEFLLASKRSSDNLAPHSSSTLQLLATYGHLSQIPVESLTPEVVLTWMPYPIIGGGEEEYETNFLIFCSRQGCYRQLPRKYQTRQYLLLKPSQWRYTPLHEAAHCGSLDKFPVETLVRGDLHRLYFDGNQFEDMDDDILHHAAWCKQVEFIQHAIDPQSISGDTIGACFSGNYFPKVIFENITAKNLLEGSPKDSALAYAAYFGHLDKVDPLLFIGDHFHQATEQVPQTEEEIVAGLGYPRINDISPNEIQRRVSEAVKWRVKVAHEKLMAKGNKVRLNSERNLESC
jgi:hypothetical protein